MIKLYGLKNCDSCRKAKKWCQNNQIDYQFIDMRDHKISQQWIQNVLEQIDYKVLINKRSTTWQQLTLDVRNNLKQENAAILAEKHPILLKRPILNIDTQYYCGFQPEWYQQWFHL